MNEPAQVAIVGAGFCGLAAAFELSRRGVRVRVLERDAEIGGLAGSFLVGGERLEKFYHHWFTNDLHVTQLAQELGTADRVVARSTRTGMYFANKFLKLSTPMDLLRFKPLKLQDRIRLGLLALRARRVKDWMSLENRTASEWLRELGGEEVYRVIWEPLLRGKFGDVADEISAVWFWNKLKLRGGSRGKAGQEQLAYYQGGFAALADAVADAVRAAGGTVETGTAVTGLSVEHGRVTGVQTSNGPIPAQSVLVTTPLPIAADLLAPHVSPQYEAHLRRIRYLANVCIVLELDRSLSETYWLNVNDPGFPFVGVIEHTNFEPASSYHGRHIVYLSKYLPESDALYQMSDDEVVEFTLGHLRRMFPSMSREWVLAAHVWRAQYSQPIVERGYSALIPSADTPIQGLHLTSMAQIYPEDRGTNYAIQQGRAIGARIADGLSGTSRGAAAPRSSAVPRPSTEGRPGTSVQPSAARQFSH